jgi:hypothetical protein
LEKRFFLQIQKRFRVYSLFISIEKLFFFWGLLFSVFWFVKRHSFKPHTLHFQLNYECEVIFTVPQICAYFVDNPLSGSPDNAPDKDSIKNKMPFILYVLEVDLNKITFCCLSCVKQLSNLGHIILITSQPVFALSP